MARARRRRTRRHHRRRSIVINRRRRYHRRRRNPVALANPVANPRRRRHHRRHHRRRRYSRRSNPSFAGIGRMARMAIYGGGGAVLTRAGTSIVQGFIPAQFGAMAGGLQGPITQALVAWFPVRFIVGKIFGREQGDMAGMGGLISAGLNLFDTYVPGLQGQIAGVFRAPVALAPGAAAAIADGAAQGAAAGAASAMAGYRGYHDVEDVDVAEFAGLGDVEDVPTGIY